LLHIQIGKERLGELASLRQEAPPLKFQPALPIQGVIILRFPDQVSSYIQFSVFSFQFVTIQAGHFLTANPGLLYRRTSGASAEPGELKTEN
jgi:hypothetical protein